MTSTQTPTGRYELGNQWHHKGLFWMIPAVGGMAPVMAMSLVNYTVADDFWSWVAVGFQYLFLTAQIAAFARMVFCYRRASKIWKGEVSS